MEIKEYEYAKIEVEQTQSGSKIYTFRYTHSEWRSLLDILNDIGSWGWMLVGEIDGEIIVMNERNDWHDYWKYN